MFQVKLNLQVTGFPAAQAYLLLHCGTPVAGKTPQSRFKFGQLLQVAPSLLAAGAY